MVAKDDLKSCVADYLRKCGYLTRGFVGDGPVRMGFMKNPEERKDFVVALKVIGMDSYLECEIVAAKIVPNNSAENYGLATNLATGVCANKCFLAAPFAFDADDLKVAAQMGVGLLEINGTNVKEVVSAKYMKSGLLDLPKHKFEGLKIAEKNLGLSEDDWGHLARVFCRAEEAFCGFNVAGVLVELGKNISFLEVDLSVTAGSIRKWATYSFLFGELAGFQLDGNDDRYTFVEKLGNMFAFGPADWNFMLNLLSKVDVCRLIFYIGSARITFAKHPLQKSVSLEVDFLDGRISEHKHKYSQSDLSELTCKKKSPRKATRKDGEAVLGKRSDGGK